MSTSSDTTMTAVQTVATILVSSGGGAAVWKYYTGRKQERIDLATASLGVSEQVTTAAYSLAQKEAARADRAEARLDQEREKHEAELAERDQKISELRQELDRLTAELDVAQERLASMATVLAETRSALDKFRTSLDGMDDGHHDTTTDGGTP